MNLETIESEAVRLSAMLLAAEDWPKRYAMAPDQHEQLIRQTARWQMLLTRFFRDMAKNATNFVNWDHYRYQTTLDYNVDVIVNDGQIDSYDGNFIQVNLQPVQNIMVTGAQAGPVLYGPPLKIAKSDKQFQRAALKKVAAMVGKKVMPDGSIVDNPSPDYNIMDTVRDDIAESVKTSLGLGETTDEAASRLEDIIGDTDRAELIADTESVNAYNIGQMIYAGDSDAVGKEWEDAGAEDICADNSDAGPIAIDGTFPSGDDEPTAHPRCRCAIRLIYPEEADRENYDF